MKIKPENPEDLWTLSTIIDKDDIVKGSTLRKVELGDKSTEKTKVAKRPMYLGITVKKIEYQSSSLKILGEIILGPEDIPRGEHHSFNLIENQEIEIEKNWLKYQLDKLDDAVNTKQTKVIACIFNREEALFAKLENNSFKEIGKIEGDVQKKDFDQRSENFFQKLAKEIENKITQNHPEILILASAHFWKSYLEKELETIEKQTNTKILFTSISDVSSSAFTELLSQKEVEGALSNSNMSKNQKLIEQFFENLAKEKPASYGLTDCLEAANAGAIDNLLVSSNFIDERRLNDTFEEVRVLFESIESQKGKITILSGKNDAVKRLDGIGGVAAFLRFKHK